MAHTPGDWVLVENPDGLPYITDQKHRVIAFIRDMGADTDGNAALIKASPKLLAACEAMLSSPTFGNEPSDEAVEMCHAAIAEAKRTVSTKYEVGNWILVKAWWLKGAACRCQIMNVWGTDSNYFDVKPMEGNPHARSIKVADIIEKIHEPDWTVRTSP